MGRQFVTMEEIARKEGLENLTPEIDLAQVQIRHRSLNRPQLYLAGFHNYLDKERIQVFGRTEYEYLKLFSEEERKEKYEALFSTGIPALILCWNIPGEKVMVEVAQKYHMPLLRTDKITAHILVNVIGWINEQLAPTITMYGVLVDVYGEGILITGDSGIGKSETAMELLKRGHRLVADDLVEISRVNEDLLFGQAPPLTRHFVELRGIGVVDVRSLYGVESVKDKSAVDMIVHLEEWHEGGNYDRLGLVEEYEDILGVKVVKHTVPIRTGRNLAIIIETAAVNSRQKKMGYNAAQELCDRVSAEVRRNKNK